MRDIISSDGGILLRRNTRFKDVFRLKLLERNIVSVYIDDEVSKGIEPEEILTTAAREKISTDIKGQFDKLQHNLALDTDTLANTANFLIEQLQSTDMVLELGDLKANDNDTYEHCIAVAILTSIVCNKLGLKTDLKVQIVMGALIHDIGKIILPKDVLNKPGRLTDEEYEIVKTHAEIGYKMIKDNPEISAITKIAVLCHHEREDGTGYPLGKKEEVHISAKIVAACDWFHAMISDRCYRRAMPVSEVIAFAQTQPMNPRIRKVIESILCYYPVGEMVILSNGKIGIIEKYFASDIRRPLVRIVDKVDGRYTSLYRINLLEDDSVYIIERYEKDMRKILDNIENILYIKRVMN